MRQNSAYAQSAKNRILRLTRTQRVQARRGKGQPRSGDWTLTIPFPAQKNSLFHPRPLYNYKFYFYIWATLAGIAQLVEHDLAKVGVEGPSPFSRSKIKEDAVKRLLLFCGQNKTRPRGRVVLFYI